MPPTQDTTAPPDFMRPWWTPTLDPMAALWTILRVPQMPPTHRAILLRLWDRATGVGGVRGCQMPTTEELATYAGIDVTTCAYVLRALEYGGWVRPATVGLCGGLNGHVGWEPVPDHVEVLRLADLKERR